MPLYGYFCGWMDQKETKFRTHVGVLEHLVGMHYLHIPARIIKAMGGTFSKRLICTVNGELSFQGGFMALGNGDAYISINKSRMKKLGIQKGDEVLLQLKADSSEYGMEMPEELSELLKQDTEGNRRFHALTPGKQRYIIQYVNTVKSSDLRINRAVLLISNLKKSKEGKESFRQMLGLE